MLKFKEVVQKGACKFILCNTFVGEESMRCRPPSAFWWRWVGACGESCPPGSGDESADGLVKPRVPLLSCWVGLLGLLGLV